MDSESRPKKPTEASSFDLMTRLLERHDDAYRRRPQDGTDSLQPSAAGDPERGFDGEADAMWILSEFARRVSFPCLAHDKAVKLIANDSMAGEIPSFSSEEEESSGDDWRSSGGPHSSLAMHTGFASVTRSLASSQQNLVRLGEDGVTSEVVNQESDAFPNSSSAGVAESPPSANTGESSPASTFNYRHDGALVLSDDNTDVPSGRLVVLEHKFGSVRQPVMGFTDYNLGHDQLVQLLERAHACLFEHPRPTYVFSIATRQASNADYFDFYFFIGEFRLPDKITLENVDIHVYHSLSMSRRHKRIELTSEHEIARSLRGALYLASRGNIRPDVLLEDAVNIAALRRSYQHMSEATGTAAVDLF